jgi:hypothetical protein
MATKKPKQTENKRRNGQFAPGNKLGNRFKPGETGNPAGRPKRTKLTDALTAKLAENAPGASEETIAERIAQALINEALNGNVQAIREIGDRTEGKPRQALEIDMAVMDWRAIAEQYGIDEHEVINEARLLIESAAASGSAESDQAEDGE